jgi:acyl transferase domain-containing protein/acyl carrier protein
VARHEESVSNSSSWALDLIRREIADIMGYGAATDVPPDATFLDLGFTSLAAVELSMRLSGKLGIDLPVTVGYDYPTPALVAGFLGRHATHEDPGHLPAAGVHSLPRTRPGERIAVVGMSCRFPGGVDSPEALWSLVTSETDAISPFPDDRGWNVTSLFDPDPDRAGHTYVSAGGFLEDAAGFDAGFFGISPREAVAMDPQQRLLLEESWTAIESAGIEPASLRGSDTAVFVGIATHDYYGVHAAAIPTQVEGWFGVGTAGSVASGRIAYSLGLEGQAITIDTACSSSLVALHLACQALRAGECSLALAGGSTVMASPMMFVEFSRQRALSPDGRCRSFAESADGTSWAEGVGILLLERLSDAERRGHPVLAVVRGSAINQDGASNGLSAPNGLAQQRVIRRALADAGLAGLDVDMVEGHGTGTQLGDSIEAQALLATYGQGRSAERPLRLGSLKSNLGHSQAAAGVGGVIKVVMAMRHGLLPRTLHVDQPSSRVDWSRGAVALLTEALPWPPCEGPRRAGVSAFGISGTNAHVILEGPPVPNDSAQTVQSLGHDDQRAQRSLEEGGSVVWAVSGRNAEALRAQAARLRAHVAAHPTIEVLDVAVSLLDTRSRFEHRAAVVGSDAGSLLAGLDAVVCGVDADEVARGVAEPRRVAFVYSGQGSQWRGMALDLLDASPVFAESFRACDHALRPHVDWCLDSVLREEPGSPGLDRDDVVQPALFAIMVSLTAVWRSCGVHPDVVIGHSQGEIAAACVAGWLSLEDAARVIALRSQSVRALAGTGGIVAVSETEPQMRARLSQWPNRLWLGGVNGPASTLVSGDLDALDELSGQCEAEGLWVKRIATSYASHSPHIEQIQGDLLNALGTVEPSPGRVSMRSTVTGKAIDLAELNASYWYRNLREPVRFYDVVRDLLDEGFNAIIEVNPHPVMAASLRGIVEATKEEPDRVAVLETLRRGEGHPRRFLTSLAQAFVQGVPVELGRLFPHHDSHRQHVPLPTYPFLRQRYWLAPAPVRSQSNGFEGHPLLESSVQVASRPDWLFGARLGLDQQPWLEDHVVMDRIVVSGTTFVELALRAGRELGCDVVEELVLELPLVITPDDIFEMQIAVGEGDEGGRRPIQIHSRRAGDGAVSLFEGAWSRHATGTLAPDNRAPASAAREPWPPAGAQPVNVDSLYEGLLAQGFAYGPAYRGLRAAWRRGSDVFAEVVLDEAQLAEAGRFDVHPALLDAAFHAAGLTLLGEPEQAPSGAWLPFAWTGVRVSASGRSSLRVRLSSIRERVFAMTATDEDGAPVARIDELVARPVSREQLAKAGGSDTDSLFCLEWVPVGVPGGRVLLPSNWAVLNCPDAWLGDVCRYSSLDEIVLADQPPEVVIAPCRMAVDGGADEVRAVVRDTLRSLQGWLGNHHFASIPLVLITRKAIALSAADQPDLACAAIWGMVRSAQSEHPDRFVLIDVDDTPPTIALVEQALASGESQLAARDGKLMAPSLARVPVSTRSMKMWDEKGTVLLTGGTSGIGAIVARHLVANHGVRHLLLVSRSGPRASGVDELATDLRSIGAEVSIAACDVADRDAVAATLSAIPDAHPLTAIVHSAGVLDDGVIESLDGPRLDRVFRPKVEGALYLDELTQHLDLDAFVLFSSISGSVGSAGQGNYAAANAVLDALACRRRAQGRSATSLAWGWWETAGAMASHLDKAHRARLANVGLVPMSTDEGLTLFEAALADGRPVLVAARISGQALRGLAAAGTLPAVFRRIVPAGATRRSRPALDLAGVPAEERTRLALSLVREKTAAILGHVSPDAVEVRRSFKDLGLDSLGAIELRNRLSASTGLRLPSTLVFDHPTPTAAAQYLLERVAGSTTLVTPSAGAELEIDAELDRVESLLAAVARRGVDPHQVAARLNRILIGLGSGDGPDDGSDIEAQIRNATAEELFRLIDDDAEVPR